MRKEGGRERGTEGRIEGGRGGTGRRIRERCGGKGGERDREEGRGEGQKGRWREKEGGGGR